MHDFIIFNRQLLEKLHFVRGTLLSLLIILLVLALITSLADGIPLFEACYFVFITALTVGYGDITPVSGLAKAISVMSGLIGIVFMGIIVAVSVRALEHAVQEKRQLLEDKSGPDDKTESNGG